MNNETLAADDEHNNGTSVALSDVEEDYEKNSSILLYTLRIYGSFYLAALLLYCLLRKLVCPRLFNIRSWVREIQCDLAMTEYGYFSWIWQVFKVASDDEIMDQCGMDALCFLRILRFGRKISLFAAFHGIWLMAIYGTAPDSPETSYLSDDWLDRISISHVPSSSPIFAGTVVAANLIYIYAMYLICKEFEWYTKFRHLFLMKPQQPRNYAVYVSGIPEAYRSSYALLEYFGQCSSHSSVLEAHIAWDVPKLEKKANDRENTIKALEHIYAVERIKRKQVTQVAFSRKHGIKRVPTVPKLERKLDGLNKEIGISIDKVLNTNHAIAVQGMRQYIRRQRDGNEVPNNNWFFDNHSILAMSEYVQSARMMHDLEKNTGTSTRMLIPLTAGIDESKEDGETTTATTLLTTSVPQQQHQQSPNVMTSVNTDDSSFVPDDNNHEIGGGANTSSYFDVLGDRRSTTTSDDHSTSTFVTAVADNDETTTSDNLWRHAHASGGTVKRRVVVTNASNKDNIQNPSEHVKHKVAPGDTIGVDDGVKMATEQYGGGIKQMATDFGTNFVTTAAAAVAPLQQYFKFVDGTPREAGFVVFSNLHATNAALQMLHHPTPYLMDVSKAPDPADIFWRNVGLPAKVHQTGVQLSVLSTTVLCLFWTVPVTTIVSLAEVGSIKESIPAVEEWIYIYPSIEMLLAQLAPLLLIILNDGVLPFFLRSFSTWEGHVAIPNLEASIFLKRAVFMIIQTFFVPAVSGSIWTALENVLREPELIIDFLAIALPGRSTFFLQLLILNAFLIQSLELLRVTPLVMALIRRCVGPNVTEKERRTAWCGILPLEDPQRFYHSAMLAKIIFMFMVLFVYSTIAPFTSIFLLAFFFMMEFCYRYQFYHNYPIGPDSGGLLWRGFIRITLACMIVSQLTLIGQLLLKRSTYATPFLGPTIAGTILFIIYIHTRHFRVTNHLPSRECNEMDRKHYGKGLDYFDFVRGKYLQPCLQNRELHPNPS